MPAPAKLAIAAKPVIRDGTLKYQKGDIVSVIPDGGDFGTKVIPPNFVRLIISDATTEQAQQYIENWLVDFKHTLVNENVNGWRFRLEVDDVFVDVSGRSKVVIRREMIDHIDNPIGGPWEGCATVSFTPTELVVDVPKNGVYQIIHVLTDNEYLLELQSDFSDIFREAVALRRWYFTEADVDAAYAQPNGEVTFTTAQVLSKLMDKLTE